MDMEHGTFAQKDATISHGNIPEWKHLCFQHGRPFIVICVKNSTILCHDTRIIAGTNIFTTSLLREQVNTLYPRPMMLN